MSTSLPQPHRPSVRQSLAGVLSHYRHGPGELLPALDLRHRRKPDFNSIPKQTAPVVSAAIAIVAGSMKGSKHGLPG